MSRAETSLLLPPGTRLLHIGPHKTGTTSLQSAFHLARRDVAAQGVHYAGKNAQPMGAAYAVTERTPPYAKPTPIGRWKALVAEIEGAGASRVVISSEGFCDAEEPAIRRIAKDLDPARVHVVITLRALTSVFPSQYQQFVQGRLALAYEPWLDAMLNRPAAQVSELFWHRHRHDQLVARWAGVVGPERVTVVVADDRDHRAVLRVFEQMVGLREETLVPEHTDANRSLTRAELELVRVLNAAFNAVGIQQMARNKVMRLGALELIKRRAPARNEPRLETPAWALDRIAEIAGEIVDGIAASGVRVVGELESLTPHPTTARSIAKEDRAAGAAAAAAWPEISAAAAMGLLLTTGLGRESTAPDSQEPWPDAWASDYRAVVADPRGGGATPISTSVFSSVLIARLRSTMKKRTPGPARGRRRAVMRRAIKRVVKRVSVRERSRAEAKGPSIHSTPVKVE